MIAIIDYGLGNLGSLRNMLRRIGTQASITSEKDKIEAAGKLILPGVGAFGNAMRNFRKLGIQPMIEKKVVEEKSPILAICLGMQLLSESSEEDGHCQGLGFIN